LDRLTDIPAPKEFENFLTVDHCYDTYLEGLVCEIIDKGTYIFSLLIKVLALDIFFLFTKELTSDIHGQSLSGAMGRLSPPP